MTRARRAARILVFACFLSPGLLLGAVRAEDDSSTLERNVKAAYLYKFAGYVDWPSGTFADEQSPVTIGVVGDDILASELSRMVVGRTSGGRPVSVQRVRAFDAVDSVRIVFISRTESPRLRPLIHTLEHRPILVVTESDGALNEGSMINFLLTKGHVRFEVGLPAVEQSGLQLSSRLLAVAQTVVAGRP